MELTPRETIIGAIFIFFLGKYLNRKIAFFRDYNIPEPVTGGILAALIFWSIHQIFDFSFIFHMETRDILLITFFTTIGLSARFQTLKEGGSALVILLVLAVLYLVIQNIIGISIAQAVGLDAVVGLLGGSVSLSGGHGTTIAWAPRFIEQYGIPNAMEIGIACATFGLVIGGLIGGPIAKLLIKRHDLHSESHAPLVVGFAYEEKHHLVDVDTMLISILSIALAIGLAIQIKPVLQQWGIDLPDFVLCLFSGIILTNTLPKLVPWMKWPEGTASLALISDLSLGLFLTMSLMSLQLWTLLGLAIPIISILLVQTLVITFFSVFVVFRLLGKSYDAAVMTSGYAGLVMGATPTAVANMTAVTERFGPSPRAFIVVPLVGAFFIDIANAGLIEFLLHLLT